MKRFALVDCNNFFVSCERVFNPKLVGKPVVVLSSNDACVIARSNEAKKLGIKMGEAAYLCKEIFKRYNVIVHSVNFALYGDMSARIMQTLSAQATDIEIYSVDEAFLYFPQMTFDSVHAENNYYSMYAQMVRTKVYRGVGIPVSIGLGPTKTLAKIANHIAKKNPACNGVFDITNHPQQQEILQSFAVGDIWGVGYRYAKMLERNGITNAYALMQKSDEWIRKNMTINGLKTVQELRGIACLRLQDNPESKKSITVSRSFGKNVTDVVQLLQASATHATTAAAKLRKQDMITDTVMVFVCYTQYNDPQRMYTSTLVQLPLPTAYTPALIAAAHTCIARLFKTGFVYKKVGIVIDNFYSKDHLQLSVEKSAPDVAKQASLMSTIDTINDRMGKDSVFFAAAGIEQEWQTKKAHKSPAYTTRWHELLTIKI